MILPKNELFNRKLNSALGSFYPEFLLTSLELSSKEDGGFEQLFNKNILFSATSIHENIHWLQFAGTSWGNLCLMINQCQADRFINAQHYGYLSQILTESKNISVDNSYIINNVEARYASQETKSFMQSWLDSYIAKSFFTIGGDSFININARDSISTALTDVVTTITSCYGNDIEKHVLELDQLFVFKDYSLIKKINNKILSIKDLLEGQARSSEVLYLLNLTHLASKLSNEKFINDVLKPYMRHSDYWDAFNIYMTIKNTSMNGVHDFIEDLSKFCLIIDIALAVPFPPYAPDNVIYNLKWDEFYPTHRFINACMVSKDLNYKFNVDCPDNNEEYISVLCEKLGWPTPTDISKYYLDNYRDSCFKFEGESYINHGIHDYFQFVFRKLSELRLQNPILIANFGLTCTGEFLNRSVEDILSIKNGFISSPLVLEMGSRAIKTPIGNTSTFQWIMLNLLHNKIINDFVFQHNSISDDDFPFDIPEWIKEHIRKMFLKNYAISINWN